MIIWEEILISLPKKGGKMEITEEILTIKEVFEIIRNGFGLGELAEFHKKNSIKKDESTSSISNEIKAGNNRLGKNQKLESVVKKLINDYVDPLLELIPNKLILDEYKEQLNNFLKNIDKKITLINSICPIKDIQKHILLYLVSTQALKIYYEIKNNGRYNPSPKKEENYIKYDDKRMLPFDIDGVPNSFHGIIEEKNLKLSELKDKNWKNWLNSGGSSMSIGSLLKEKEEYLGEIENFYVDCFFKRVQWKAFNELKNTENGEQLIIVLQRTMSGVLNLSTDISYEEFMNFSFNKMFEEIGKADNITDSKKLEEAKKQFNMATKVGLKFVEQLEKNSESMMDLMKPITLFNNPLELKDKISVEKLEKDKLHGELIKIHQEYNKLKDNYSLNGHKKLYSDKLEEFINSNNKYYKGYFSYFIFDSIYLIENNLEELKGPPKQNLQKLNKKFKEVSKYRCSKDYWDGKKIDYLDYYLTSLLMEKPVEGTTENYSPQFMENLAFFKNFSKEESLEKIKQGVIQYKEYFKELAKDIYEE